MNNAGVYGRRLTLLELEEEDFLFSFQTNTIGPFLVVQQLLKQVQIKQAPRRTQISIQKVPVMQ